MSNVVNLDQVKALLGYQYYVATAYILIDQVEQNPNIFDSIPAEKLEGFKQTVESARQTVSLHERPPEWIMKKVIGIITKTYRG